MNTEAEKSLRSFNFFEINVLASCFSLSGTESSKSKQTISAGRDFAFSKNLGLFPGTKIKLRKRFVFK